MNEALTALGWTAAEDEAFEPYKHDLIPGRIAMAAHEIYVAFTADGDLTAPAAGRLRHLAGDDHEGMPAVGDFVGLRVLPTGEASVNVLLPRRTAFVRKEAGFKTYSQVLATNIDYVWIVAALTREISARRVERYLSVAWESGAQPLIVLTKADLGQADPERVAEVERVCVGADVIVTSAVTGEGVDELREQLSHHRSAALLGSSGVGKSTLINTLVGEELIDTQETRRDDVGRHTTARRELVRVPTGGVVIDTPGLREVLAWGGAGADEVYAAIETLMSSCRFNDCGHTNEPGCAVRAAIAAGDLDPAQIRQYEKMQRENRYLNKRKRGREKAVAQLERRRKLQKIEDEEMWG